MRVLLASGLFYPDVGGPATHVRKIADHFSARDWSVTVVSFGEQSDFAELYQVIRVSRRIPKVLSWLLYALALAREAWRADIVYAFDLTTAGIPSAFFAKLFRKKFVVRIGGDPIWEREAEAGRRLMPITEYYRQGLFAEDRPRLYALLRRCVQTADRIIVYNTWFRDFYVQYFDADPGKIEVIPNPALPKQASAHEVDMRTCIFAGRFVAYKNLERVILAAAQVFPKYPHARLLFVGDGPEKKNLEALAHEKSVPLTIRPKTDQKELFNLIAASSVALAPALSEFNPNFVLESLSFGKPAIISRGHGLSVDLPDWMQFDPMSVESLAQTLDTMLSDEGYARAVHVVSELPLQWSWTDVLREQERVIRGLV